MKNFESVRKIGSFVFSPGSRLQVGAILLVSLALPMLGACQPKDPQGSSGGVSTGGGGGGGGSPRLPATQVPVIPAVTSILPAAGETTGSTLITIEGVNLSEVSSVALDGLTCTLLTITSDRKLTCKTPAHPVGPVYVVLTTSAELSTSVANGYTYRLPISVSIGDPSVVLVNSTGTVTYPLTYTSASSVTLSSSDITLTSTGTATCSKAVSGSGTETRTVTLTNCTGDGTVAISVGASTASDVDGKFAAAAGPSTAFTVDNTAPLNASGLGWSQPSPYAGTTLSAMWTKSVSPDLGNQQIQFYTGSACNATSGGALDLSSTTVQTRVFTGSDGTTYSYRILSVDRAGNTATSGCSTSVRLDLTPPSVTAVSSTTAAGNYKAGAAIALQVVFSEAVNVTTAGGTPTLTLETGATDRQVAYASGSGTDTLVFNYTVQAGDTTLDLDYASTGALALAGGIIADLAGNNATLTLASPGAATSLGANEAIVIDTTAPVVSAVSSTAADGAYRAGDVLDVTVTFSESVTVNTAGGIPTLTLETGATDRTAAYLNGSGSTVLKFRYTVQAGDAASDLDYVATGSLLLNNGTIQDAAANDATLTLAAPGAAGSLALGKALVVDTVAPTVTAVTATTANGAYKAGQSIDLTVTFSETVQVNLIGGTPYLTVETGATDRNAVYQSGTGTTTLAFTYTVQAGDTSLDLDYISTGALLLGGGTVRDAASNDAVLTLAAPAAAGSLGANRAIVIDTTAPTVSGVTATTANGSYKAGQSVDVTVTFSENVDVTGTPILTLETGGTDRDAAYASGTGTSVLTFTYTIQAGDTSSDLDYVAMNSLALSGGTIKDTALNAATLTLASPAAAGSLGANRAIVIDTTAPTVSGVSATTANGSYKAGQSVDVTVAFSENVDVTGTPILTLETGGTDRDATYASGTGTSTLTFTYTIQAGDTSSDLDYVATNSLALSGGTIKDTALNAATLTLASPAAAGSLGANRAIIIDTTAPTVSGVSATTANGSYKAGQTVDVTVTFSENVDVTGTPILTLETGGTDRDATYASGTGTSTLTFTYTIQAGDTSSDLDYVATNSLALNGGTIKDTALNVATLTLAAPAAAGSLGANRAIIIDTTAPTVSGVTATTANGSYKAGQSVDVTVTFSENVNVTGTPILTLETGGTDRDATYASGTGTGTLTFTYTIQAGDTSADLDYVATNSLALSGGTIKDTALNATTLTLASPAAAGSLGANRAIVIDTTAPTVSGVTATTANGSYKAGQSVDVTVTFSENVDVTGTPILTLETGGTDRDATYASGTGTGTLTFTYTIQAGDTTGDLDYVATNSLALSGGTIKDTALNAATLTLANPAAAGSLGANRAIVIDTTAPTVSGVSATTANGSYKAGQTVDVTVTFSENVDVTGTPILTLETGGTDRDATYASGTGTNTLTFTYTVQAGDTSSDLDYVATNSLALSGGTIKDTALNVATLTLAAPAAAGSLGANRAIIIDTTAPTVSGVSATTANGSYKAGQTVDVTVTFSENVVVTGTPVLTLETGGTDRDATYASGTGTSTLTFTYTIQAGDTSSDLDYVATNSLTLSGGTIKDPALNVATLTLAAPAAAGSLGANRAIVIDTTVPTVSAVSSSTGNGTYKLGDTVAVEVTFSETVIVNTSGGVPTLTIETGTPDRDVTYSSGSGTSTLVFNFTIGAGDISADLDFKATDSFALNGATITDGALNSATLTLVSPGAAGSLGNAKNIVVDGAVPTVSSVSASTANGSYKAGQTVDVTVSFSETVNVTGTPLLNLETGTTDRDASYSSGTGTSVLTFSYTVQATDTTADLDYIATGSLVLSGGTIKDAALNAATLTLASPGAANSLGANKAIVIDTTMPTVSSVSASQANGTYGIGVSMNVIVNFSESVTVDTSGGTPTITLETGGTDRAASYSSGSGTSALTFTYVIQSADSSSDLDYTATNSLALNSGTIRDTAGNDATLTLANPGAANSLGANKSLVIDGNVPTVSAVSASTANGSYKAGQSITVTVTFTEIVTVDTAGGTPTITLETGGTDRDATFSSGSGSATLSFVYTVQGGDSAIDLDFTATNSLALNSGTIRDAGANDATLTLAAPGAAGSLAANKAIIVDTVVPTVTGVSSTKGNGSYNAGTSIPITVTFSEAVFVSTGGGTPTLTLETGGTDRAVTYTSGTGTTVLTFNYVVQAGDTTLDLDYTATNALVLNGGTITDAATNAATLTLANPGAANSLADNKELLIDSTAPTVTGVTSNTANGSYKATSVIDVRVQFDSAVFVDTGGGSPYVTLETGSTDRNATYSSGSGTTTLVYSYTVQASDTSSDLEYIDTTALVLNSSTIKDAAGNNATLTLPATAGAGSLGNNQNLVIDTTAPTVSNVTASTGNGSYNEADAISVTVTFSEVVNVTTGGGTPNLTLETGGTDRTATYQSGTGTAVLTFLYTVQAGDTASDLDYVANSSLSENGGTIRDAATNDATLTMANPAAAGSLGANKAIIIDTTAPTVAAAAPSSSIASSGATITYEVTYTGADDVTLIAANVTLNTTGGATCSKAVTGAGVVTRTVTLTNCTGNGTVGITINSSTATDNAGNSAAASAASATFSVDNTAPTAATGLTWSEGSPSNSANVTASWTKSASGDLSNQKIQFYTDSDCTVTSGTLIDLASAATQTRAFTGNANTSYNYTVTSFDSAGNSVTSGCSATMAINVLPLDLEVPYEMLDRGASSSSGGAGAVGGTSTPLRTDDFDGTVTYVFEVVALNTDGSNRSVYLVDQTDTTKATITINASTTSLTRFRTTWTPNATADDNQIYRLKLDATASDDQLYVSTARILVQQTDGTKTKLFIPLTAGSSSGYANVGTSTSAYIDQTASTAYTQADASVYSIWRKNTAVFADLAAGSPWSFVTVADTSCNTARVSLFNKTSGNQVVASEVSTAAATPQFLRADFADNAADFANGSDFEVRIKSGDAGCTAQVFRAGLLLKLTNLSKAQVYYRVGRKDSLGASDVHDKQRALIDTSLFGNPAVYYESVGSVDALGTGGTSLKTSGVNDSGTGGSSAISNSARSFTSSKSRLRSGALSITSGDRYIQSVDVTAGTVTVNQSFVIIDTH